MIYQCQFGQNLAIASEDRAQCFHSYMTLVTLKIRPRSPKSDHFKILPMVYLCQFGKNLAMIFGRKGAAKAFTYTYMTKLTLNIKSRSPKSDHLLNSSHWLIHVSLRVWSKSGHYFSSKWVQTMFIIALTETLVSLKIGQGHQNLIIFSKP